MEEKNIKNHRKLKIVLFMVISIIFVVILAAFIVNACIPTLSEEDVKNILIDSAASELEVAKEQLQISDIGIDIEINKFEYKKKTIFSKGYIKVFVTGQYVSDDFEELENKVFTKETCKKYSQIDFLGFSDVEFDGYEVDATGIVEGFKTSKGDVYMVEVDEIRIDDVLVFGKRPQYNPPASNDKTTESTKCERCGGVGKIPVKWYSEGDWGTTSYSNYTCTQCNGTGKK